ncbi:MAG: hypothetical protein K2X82_30115 [Gemmataceae bacterium]|nr:hypothetical protein [Gemmataceae bacterium]
MARNVPNIDAVRDLADEARSSFVSAGGDAVKQAEILAAVFARLTAVVPKAQAEFESLAEQGVSKRVRDLLDPLAVFRRLMADIGPVLMSLAADVGGLEVSRAFEQVAKAAEALGESQGAAFAANISKLLDLEGPAQRPQEPPDPGPPVRPGPESGPAADDVQDADYGTVPDPGESGPAGAPEPPDAAGMSTALVRLTAAMTAAETTAAGLGGAVITLSDDFAAPTVKIVGFAVNADLAEDELEEWRDETERFTAAAGAAVLSYQSMTRAVTAAAAAGMVFLGAIEGMVGSFQRLAHYVELFDPGLVYQFNVAVRDMGAAIGSNLTPLIRSATEVVKTLGDAFAGTGPQTKRMISAVLAAGIAFTAAAAAATVVGMAVTFATGGLSAVVAGVAGLAVYGSGSKTASPLAPLMDMFTSAIEPIAAVFMSLVGAVTPVVTIVVQIVTILVRLGVVLNPATLALMALMAVIELVADVFGYLADELSKFIGEAIKWFDALFGVRRPEGRSAGMATAQATFSSASALAEKAYASAYSLGSGGTDEDRRNGEVTSRLDAINAKLQAIYDWWTRAAVAADKVTAAAEKVGDFALDAPGRLARGVRDFFTEE